MELRTWQWSESRKRDLEDRLYNASQIEIVVLDLVKDRVLRIHLETSSIGGEVIMGFLELAILAYFATPPFVESTFVPFAWLRASSSLAAWRTSAQCK